MAARRCLSIAGLLLLLLPRVAVPCQTISATTITANTTWGPTGSPASDCYLITSTITISNTATLTIQPGTTLYFASGVSLIIGGTTAGQLMAIGSDAQPIVFTSGNALHGGWAGLSFANYSDLNGASSTLDHCIVEKGGTTGASGAMIKVTDSNGLILTNSMLRKFRNYGLQLSNAQVTVSQCTFSDSIGAYPATGSFRDVSSLFALNDFVPRGSYDGILIPAGTLTQSTVLSTPDPGFCYLLGAGEFLVEAAAGPTLGISPGTVMKFSAGARLLTGYNSNGGLQARGVVFTSSLDDTIADTPGDGATSGNAGQWRCLFFGAHVVAGSYVDSCAIRYGGATDLAGLRLWGAMTITRSVIEKNTGNAIMVEGASVTAGNVTGNLFRDNTSYEVLAPPVAMASLVPANTIAASANGKLNAYVLQAGTTTLSTTLPKPAPGFCYLFETGESLVEAASGPMLGIAPGTVVKFPAGARLLIGYNSSGGLQARGIVFTSSLDDTLGDTPGDGATSGLPGQWRCVLFGTHIAAGSYVDSCAIRYGGATDNAGLRLLGPMTVTRSVIEKNTGNGVLVEGASVTEPGVTGNLLRDNSSYEVMAPPVAMADLVPANTIALSADGRLNGYYLQAGAVTMNVTLPKPAPGFCYLMETGDSNIEAGAGATLRIAPGTVVKFMAGARWVVGNSSNGTLNAKGVLFTSAQDDTISDTNGDGATAPAAGQWRGLYYGSHCGVETVLMCSMVRYAGATSAHAIEIQSGSPAFSYCVVTSNSGDGFYVNGTTAAPSIYGCTVTANTDQAVDIATNANPMMRHCNFGGNVGGGVRTSSTTVIPDALMNWWGHSSGPADPSANPPDQNPGSGAAVSDYVHYRPWRTTVFVPTCDMAVSVPDPPLPVASAGLALLGAQPNPSTASPRIALALPDAAPARLEVYDVAGRRVAALEVGGLGAGTHLVALPIASLRPGIYAVKLVRRDQQLRSRFIVLP